MNNCFYIENHGCPISLVESNQIIQIMHNNGFHLARQQNDAAVLIVNTCSVRDGVERMMLERLRELNQLKKNNSELIVCVVGCMATRLKHELIENNYADIVVGNDSYLQIPILINALLQTGEKTADTALSETEMYCNISQYIKPGSISAGIIVTRGCNNFCTYCIVPYIRGRERSKDLNSSHREITDAKRNGCKEIVLMGQNVSSYLGREPERDIDFPALLNTVATEHPDLRIRFFTSHPKDINERLFKVIATHKNIAKHIHLPVQSGSNAILKKNE